MKRRTLLTTAGALAATARIPLALAADTTGITATSIKVGETNAYSGPASSYGAIGHGLEAFFKMVNAEGGINGRKIDFIPRDDGYSPPRCVQETRRLVEQDKAALILNGLGTPTQSAVQKYMNEKKVPQLFVATGASKFGNYKQYPWTMGWQPAYPVEAGIYMKHLMATKPDAKLAILYQNDDFGKDYLNGAREALGDKAGKIIVKTASYETSDPTVDSQVVALQGSGADTLLVGAIPKFAAQAISKVYDLKWKPTFYMTNVSISVGAVMEPAGENKAVGMISAGYMKDPTDHEWDKDAGMNEWRAFMKKWLPNADMADNNYVFAYGVGSTFLQVLRQCGKDVTRENIMKQAANLKNLAIPTLLPGVEVNTSPTNYYPIRSMQLQRWDGKTWVRFGNVLSA
jgi:branched-chain amino acid transport system substrate-binding protein